MGCSGSVDRAIQYEQEDCSHTDTRHWYKTQSEMEARTRYEADGTVAREANRLQVELRSLLDYPVARQFLLDVVSSPDSAPFLSICLLGWLDIQSFNAMIDSRSKTVMGCTINRKYIQSCPLVHTDEQLRFMDLIEQPGAIVSGVFDKIQSLFFKGLFTHMFVSFRKTSKYQVMCSTLRRKYNRVKHSDFVYHQVGQGGYGMVCEVSKKSTGVRYAMKLQRKVNLVSIFGEEPWRVDMEKRAFARCHHPFIVELLYAFQTESLVLMVITLGTGRDLSNILRSGGPLSANQVTFYAAEITSALSYLHDKGFVYRDLKPANVLLCMDGHIKLVDFGGVCDISGNLLGMRVSALLYICSISANCELLLYVFAY